MHEDRALTLTPLSAGIDFTLEVKSDGTVRGWGYNAGGNLGDGTTPQRLTPVRTVAFGP